MFLPSSEHKVELLTIRIPGHSYLEISILLCVEELSTGLLVGKSLLVYKNLIVSGIS